MLIIIYIEFDDECIRDPLDPSCEDVQKRRNSNDHFDDVDVKTQNQLDSVVNNISQTPPTHHTAVSRPTWKAPPLPPSRPTSVSIRNINTYSTHVSCNAPNMYNHRC